MGSAFCNIRPDRSCQCLLIQCLEHDASAPFLHQMLKRLRERRDIPIFYQPRLAFERSLLKGQNLRQIGFAGWQDYHVLFAVFQRHINGALKEIKRQGSANHQVVHEEVRSSLNAELLGIHLIFSDDVRNLFAVHILGEALHVHIEALSGLFQEGFTLGNELVSVGKERLIELPGLFFALLGYCLLYTSSALFAPVVT